MRLTDLTAASHYAGFRQQIVDMRDEVLANGLPRWSVGNVILDTGMQAALVPVLIEQFDQRIAFFDDQLRQRGIVVD